MNLHKLLFEKNECYIINREVETGKRSDKRYSNYQKNGPSGIMVHSTGASNNTLRRYVGPDDGLLGNNPNNNYWNQFNPGGRQVCVHAFIGVLKDDKTIATYQVMPWNYRTWHGGSGKNGCINDTHIGFEINEDRLTNAEYFNSVYVEATELCAMLCKEYKLDPLKNGVLIDHSEGWRMGLASDHSDVGYWFTKFNKSMAHFRDDVKKLLESKPIENNNKGNEAVTQEQFNKMMDEWLNQQKYKPISEWAEKEFNEAVNVGITDGKSPLGIITREQAAIMALRASKKGN